MILVRTVVRYSPMALLLRTHRSRQLWISLKLVCHAALCQHRHFSSFHLFYDYLAWFISDVKRVLLPLRGRLEEVSDFTFPLRSSISLLFRSPFSLPSLCEDDENRRTRLKVLLNKKNTRYYDITYSRP